MEIVLHPRAGPSDCLRVWIGAFQATSAPALAWTIDGLAAEPVALMPIRSARTDDLLPTDQAPDNLPRTFTGVYEFGGLEPDSLHTVSVTAEGTVQELSVRTLPGEIPADLDRWFNVLLVSCHHAAEDRRGLSGTIVSQIKTLGRPQLSILGGDQVYLDLPTLQNFQDDEVWLAGKFERDYNENWRGPDGYAQVLDAAPSISIPDDHEYWNNFPHPSPFIQNAWSQDGRDRWQRAAQAMFRGFQLHHPDDLGKAFILDVHPLSFFIADTRSGKDPDRRFTMPEAEHQQMSDWVDRVVEKRLFPVFVSGQSLFVDPVSLTAGAIADYELSNYGDFARILTTLQRVIDEARRPLLCLTGDVHWGRMAAAQDITTGRTSITEIISSPSSLVTTIGADTIKTVGGFLHGLFGAQDPWPRHGSPGVPPAFLGSDALGRRYPCTAIHGQKGNNVALLSFRQAGGGVECRVTYWPIHSDTDIARAVELDPFQLAPG